MVGQGKLFTQFVLQISTSPPKLRHGRCCYSFISNGPTDSSPDIQSYRRQLMLKRRRDDETRTAEKVRNLPSRRRLLRSNLSEWDKPSRKVSPKKKLSPWRMKDNFANNKKRGRLAQSENAIETPRNKVTQRAPKNQRKTQYPYRRIEEAAARQKYLLRRNSEHRDSYDALRSKRGSLPLKIRTGHVDFERRSGVISNQANRRKQTPMVEKSTNEKHKQENANAQVAAPRAKGPLDTDVVVTNFPPSNLDIQISCLPGLEKILSEELTALNIEHDMKPCGAQLSASTTTLDNLLDCHLYLGSAANILLKCGEPFKARGLAELRRKTALLPWNAILPQHVQLKDMRVKSTKSKLYHSGAIQERIFNGIYEALGHDVPDNPANGIFVPPRQEEEHDCEDDSHHVDGAVKLDVRLLRDEVHISIDTSSTPLHRRGYRLEATKAPLREDIAFALLFRAGWRPTFCAAHKEQPSGSATFDLANGSSALHARNYTSLLDPLCGSGTIAIEGAAMAAGMAPGRLRPAPLAGTLLYDPDQWNARVRAASERSRLLIEEDYHIAIAASDRDEGAVAATRSNASRAGVLSLLDIQCKAFSAHPWLDRSNAHSESNVSERKQQLDRLLVASNLPYGKRLSPSSGTRSSADTFLRLYQGLGHRINSMVDAGQEVGAAFLGNDARLTRRTDIKGGLELGFSCKHGGMAVSALFSPRQKPTPKTL